MVAVLLPATMQPLTCILGLTWIEAEASDILYRSNMPSMLASPY
jgi:hypothetical protein